MGNRVPFLAITDGNDALGVPVPCNVIDTAGDDLDLTLENLFLTDGVPDADVTGDIWQN